LTERRGLLARLLPDPPRPPDDAGSGFAAYDLRSAWRRGDAGIEADAVAFWNRLAILPRGVRPEERARDLVAVAYRDGRAVGVATASFARIEALRGRFAALRCAVDPDHRRERIAAALTILSRDLIEAWSADHPEERVLGLAGVVAGPDLAAREREPVWPATRLNLVGYTPEGRQIRVAWFAHARLD
jgi:GNAT superfamily N-acetyltransferase